MPKYTNVAFFVDDLNSSFTINELNNLASNFKTVSLFSTSPISAAVLSKYANVSNIETNFKQYSPLKTVLGNFGFLFHAIIKEFFLSSKYLFHLSLFKQKISELVRSMYLADEVTKKLLANDTGETLYYSFWFNQWATVLALLNKKKQGSENCITRAHGIDIYEERIPDIHRIAFRWLQLKYISSVFSVSNKGASYLKNKYPAHQAKISTVYLGTAYSGSNPFNKQNTFTIVSCAKIRNLKRIHLIPEILMYIDFPINWIHIGDEDKTDPDVQLLHANLSVLKKNKTNVNVQFLGNLDNTEVFKFYGNNSINLFVSVSKTEGLPVSMMEALSFGIPIMATDVGGCPEIVNEQTGFLITKDFNPEETAKQIKAFSTSEKNTVSFRLGATEYWKNNFNSTDNFNQFLKNIS